MRIKMLEADESDVDTISSILTEAALWLREESIPLWGLEEVTAERVRKEMASHLYVLAEVDGDPAGTMRFQLEDPVTWPDVPDGESTFIHRLAVRRKFAGGEVSKALVEWAIGRTQEMGRPYLRLDYESPVTYEQKHRSVA